MPDRRENDNDISENTQSCCYPGHTCYRFIALVFMCFMGFGSYFCYDNPGALQDNFKADLHMSTTQFVLLYSIYSWPNVILCFIGGYLIDRVFGVRLGTIIYMVILLIGAILFAMGGYTNLFWLMVVGRFIFGIGGESLAVAQNNYAVVWFKGKELNMVFGLQLSLARMGSTVNFIVMEPLYKWVSNYYTGYHKIGVVLFIASLTCLGSLLCVLILGWMDLRAERVLNRRAENPNDVPFKLTDVRHFSMTFWLVSIICVTYYVAVFPFIALGKMFFERKFDFSPEDANLVNSIVYIISAMMSPLLGFLIDKTGRNLMWVISSIILTIGAHSLLTFSFANPYLGMCLMGLSYSMLASGLWPLVALIIPENQLGSAYGICQSVQNLGLAVVSLLTGMIVDKFGYFMLEMFFLGCLFVSLIASVLIWVVDSANKGTLNMTPTERDGHCAVEENESLLDNEWTNDAEPVQDQALNNQSDRIRTRYLARIGTHSDNANFSQLN